MRFLRSLPKSFVSKNSVNGRFFIFKFVTPHAVNTYLKLFAVSKIFNPFYFNSHFFGFNNYRSLYLYSLFGFPFIRYNSSTFFQLQSIFSIDLIIPSLKVFIRRLHFSCCSHLRAVLSERFLFLKKLNNYKIIRNILGLSVRGQRTHTNCLTQKKRARGFSNSKKRSVIKL